MDLCLFEFLPLFYKDETHDKFSDILYNNISLNFLFTEDECYQPTPATNLICNHVFLGAVIWINGYNFSTYLKRK